ncbi:hypothetical protein M2G99_21625 [Vibrio vulnificus]|nr:hypothetical protein [Vibrio vulnificus]MCU8348149.1 hypothetical protein [Vibrio vulnificus]MCU8422142.1 hypothetical protein [Vibrio vulnificus]
MSFVVKSVCGKLV